MNSQQWRLSLKAILSVLTLSISIGIYSNTVHSKEFIVAALSEYAPYSIYTEEDGWQGYGIELAERLIQTPNNEHSLGYMKNPSWPRSISSIQHGSLDFLWEVSYTQERSEFMEYVGISDVERMKLLIAESAQLDPIEELDDFFKVPTAIGHSHAFITFNPKVQYDSEFSKRLKSDDKFAKLFRPGPVITPSLGEGTWGGMLVSLGRIPARIYSESSANLALSASKDLIEKNPNAVRLKAVSIPAFGTPVTYLVIPKSMPVEYKQLIHKNYAEARTDGSFDKIWQKWFGDKEVPPNYPVPKNN